ncbi:MAG: type II toxin-antitoxin system Phd/YefM family antitoxin [Synergistaceae bacterium]|jgi:antitoxin (DNA-binding transcriptional repressor) of toxin-antitoxin stability system|nr:type II toxin-antitoxin system Phd/YefM family antitoxin [Synergistaceae bacterium]
MKTIPVHKAKSNLSQLIKLAADGETILIGGYGKPQAMLTSITAKPKKQIGLLRGKLIVPDDFDAPLPEDELAAFGGK